MNQDGSDAYALLIAAVRMDATISTFSAGQGSGSIELVSPGLFEAAGSPVVSQRLGE